MEQQIKWHYCEQSTQTHELARKNSFGLEKIADIIQNEGGGKSDFSAEVALNLDKIETEKAKKEKRNKNSSMDMAFCIQDKKNVSIVLVELRLRYKEADNLSKTELDKKINCSKQMVSSDISTFNSYYFVFSESLKQQAYNKLRRLYANKSTHIALSVKELHEKFFTINF